MGSDVWADQMWLAMTWVAVCEWNGESYCNLHSIHGPHITLLVPPARGKNPTAVAAETPCHPVRWESISHCSTPAFVFAITNKILRFTSHIRICDIRSRHFMPRSTPTSRFWIGHGTCQSSRAPEAFSAEACSHCPLNFSVLVTEVCARFLQHPRSVELGVYRGKLPSVWNLERKTGKLRQTDCALVAETKDIEPVKVSEVQRDYRQQYKPVNSQSRENGQADYIGVEYWQMRHWFMQGAKYPRKRRQKRPSDSGQLNIMLFQKRRIFDNAKFHVTQFKIEIQSLLWNFYYCALSTPYTTKKVQKCFTIESIVNTDLRRHLKRLRK